MDLKTLAIATPGIVAFRNMREFTYIDENNEHVLDLLHLFEHAFDYKIDTNAIVTALNEIQKHVKIEPLINLKT